MGLERRSTETVLNMARISLAAPQGPAIAVDDSAEKSFIIDILNHAVELFNAGPDTVYYGGDGVTASNGIPLFEGDKKIFTNVENTFILKFRCATGKTASLREVQYR